MPFHELNICWEIENYLFNKQRNGLSIRSKNFLPTSTTRNYCYIYLYPKEVESECEGYVSLHLFFSSSVFTMIGLNMTLCEASHKVIMEMDENKGSIRIPDGFLFNKMIKSVELEKMMKKCTNDCLIVRCKLRMEKKRNEECALGGYNIAAKTIIDFDKNTVDMGINLDNSLDAFRIKLFTDMLGSQFEAVVRAPEDEVLIEIGRVGKPNDQDQKVKCHIFLLDKEEKVMHSRWDFFLFHHKSVEGNTWRFPPFLKKSSLVGDKSGQYFILRFHFFISNGKSLFTTNVEEKKKFEYTSLSKVSDNPVLDSLQGDLHAMLSSKKYTDVKLLVDNETINAHKNILASRSPVFWAMFDHQDMIENQTGEIKIDDISADTMKLFLKFLYTGTLDELDSEKALELLLAAEKYQVPSLKLKCSDYLVMHLDADNICDVVSVADMVGCEILKTAAINYIEEHTEEVLGSSKWPKWFEKNVKLGSEIVCKLSKSIRSAK